MPRPMNSGGTGVQAWFSSLLIMSATIFHKSGKFSVNGPVASKDLKVGVSLYFRRKTLCVNKDQYLAHEYGLGWSLGRCSRKKQKQVTINSLLLKIKYVYTCKLYVKV